MADNKQNRCPRCGAPKTSESKGSLTQWIAVCRCDLKAQTPTEHSEALQFCAICAKRINPGRAGSLTQWILRGDICNCKNPVPTNLHPARHAEIAAEVRLPDETDSELLSQEPELDVSIEMFPKERYKAVELIGSGGSGQVYRCLDRILGKQVAIKLLLTLTSGQVINFQREAKAGSVLQHAGLVSVRDFGVTAGGAPYMVMDYVSGISLDKYIEQNGPLAESLAEELFAQIGEALSYAHQKGIFHRDLKTSNIIVSVPETGEPQASIIDFGVSSVIQEITVSSGNNLVGTPAYMSPDQANGLPFDARSEIYALGCVMFESLTGTVPFAGDTALATINMHASSPPPSLSERSSADMEFSEKFESIVACCLEKDPERRYQSLEELIGALRQSPKASAQELFTLPEDSLAFDSQLQSRSNSKLALIVASIFVVVIIVGCLGFNSLVDTLASKSGTVGTIPNWNQDAAGFGNEVSDTIKDGIGNIEESKVEFKSSGLLKVREGRDKDLEKAVAIMPGQQAVKGLIIEGGKFSPAALESLRKLDGVESLFITGVDLSKVNSFALKKATVINVTDCKLAKGRAFSIFEHCPVLETLYYFRCTIDNDSFKALSRIKQVHHIGLYSCSGVTDGWQYATSLTGFSWSAADLKTYPGEGFRHALKLPQLSKVTCETGMMTDEQYDEVVNVPYLNGLLLTGKRKIDNANLEKIKRVRSPEFQLSLKGPCIDLDSFKALSGHKWKKLAFYETKLNDAGLALISNLDVAELILDEPEITLNGLTLLLQKNALKALLLGSQCPEFGKSQLRELRRLSPQCQILYYSHDQLMEMSHDGETFSPFLPSKKEH